MGTEESFGRFIAIRRKHLQLTQADLANKMGVSKSAIAKWETGGGLPDRNNLRKLSEAINLSVDELHRAIEHEETKEPVLQVNITPEVIAMLESKRVTTLQQAINLYEDELRHHEMVAMHQEQLRVQQEQLRTQQEQVTTLQEMEENRKADARNQILGTVLSAGIGAVVGHGLSKFFRD